MTAKMTTIKADAPPGGFKQTEIGLIPEEWGISSIGSLFEIQQGKALSARNQTGKSPRPFLRTANVFWGRLDLNTVDSMDFTDQEAERLSLRVDDLLVCEGGDIGRTAIWRGEIEGCSYQNHIHRLRAKDTNVEPLFYMYWMQAAMLLFRLYGGEGNKTTIPNLSKARLSTFQIPTPPLPEQRTIAHVLSKIQATAQAQAAIAERARELKRALMAKLFTEGLRGEPLKETGIGPMPESWQIAHLSELAHFKNGINFSRDQKGSGILTVDVLNMYSDSIQVEMGNLYRVNINLKDDYRLQSNDILLVRSSLKQAGVGWPALFTGYSEPVTFCGFLIRARLTSMEVHPIFLLYYLRLPATRAMLVSKSGKVAITNINQGNLGTVPIPMPPLNEQQEIARILQTVDAKFAAAERKRAGLEELFRAMLGELMRGSVRVTGLADRLSGVLA